MKIKRLRPELAGDRSAAIERNCNEEEEYAKRRKRKTPLPYRPRLGTEIYRTRLGHPSDLVRRYGPPLSCLR